MLLTRVAQADGGVALTLAVTLARAKKHINVMHSADDDEISEFILKAQAHLEGHDGTGGVLGRAVSRHVLELALPGFPSGSISLPQPPIDAVSSVTYTDPDGAAQTIAAENYAIVPHKISPSLALAPGASWPSTRAGQHNAVVIRFICGFTDVPIDIQHAILMHVAHLYENRGAAGENMVALPLAYQSLLGPWRTHGWV